MDNNYKKINLDESNLDIDTVIEDIKENILAIKKLTNELEKIKELSLTNTNSNDNVNPAKIDTNLNLDEFDFSDDEEDNIVDEIYFYYPKILSVNLERNDAITLLEKELPRKNNFRYKEILFGINIHLMKDINEIKNFIESNKNDFAKEDLVEFKNEIINLDKKINIIKELIIKTDKLESDEIILENKNNIVFLNTNSGNIYALKDLTSIPTEYYDGFMELILSIENGTFKNVKYLTGNNNKTSGISEVKGDKMRVIFDRVGYNTYVIIDIFTKKSDNDKSYIDPLKNRIAVYRKNKEDIVKKVEDQEYLDEQKNILNDVYTLLKTKNKRGL